MPTVVVPGYEVQLGCTKTVIPGAIDISTTDTQIWGVVPNMNGGTNVSRTVYDSLFRLFGTTYGPGDGSTTFGLPGNGIGIANFQVIKLI